MDSTIFNDAAKLKRTREKTAEYFKTGPNYAEKAGEAIRGFLGGSSSKEKAMSDALRKKRSAYGS